MGFISEILLNPAESVGESGAFVKCVLSRMSHELLRKKVESASKEELLVMLVEGAHRFATQGLDEMKARNFQTANELYIKSQKILLELIKTLDKRVLDKKVYDNLIGLYAFCFRRLVEGNVKKDEKMIMESLKILRDLRELWRDAVNKFHKEGANQQPSAAAKRTPGSLDFSG